MWGWGSPYLLSLLIIVIIIIISRRTQFIRIPLLHTAAVRPPTAAFLRSPAMIRNASPPSCCCQVSPRITSHRHPAGLIASPSSYSTSRPTTSIAPQSLPRLSLSELNAMNIRSTAPASSFIVALP